MDRERPAAERIGDVLTERGETIAVAESCTGGLLGSTITGVPGSSDYFGGGVIAYDDRTKRRMLAITREALEAHGAVSGPVASAMARHVRDETGADWALSTTGYAGPSGGDADRPVGTVYIGVAYAGAADGSSVGDGDTGPEAFAHVEDHRFDGARTEVKERIVEQALRSALEAIEAVADAE